MLKTEKVVLFFLSDTAEEQSDYENVINGKSAHTISKTRDQFIFVFGYFCVF